MANLVERLSILYPNGVVDVHDLPEKYRSQDVVARAPVAEPVVVAGANVMVEKPAALKLPRAGLDLKEHLNTVERDLINQALDESNWVVAHAAKRLQMGRTTLVEKMRKLDVSREEQASGL